jgi:hypothetical protein
MNTQTIKLILAGSLGIALASTSPALAQTTLGGAKTQQNKIGGVAKPAPVVGDPHALAANSAETGPGREYGQAHHTRRDFAWPEF